MHGLTDAQVGVDRSITGSAGQVLVLSVWNMEVCLWVTVLLGQTEINDIDLVTTLSDAHQEVVWLDITVNKGLGVDVLDARDELVGEQQNGLQGELAVAEVEEILKGWAEEIQDHSIVVALSSKPANEWNSDSASQRLVDASLILQLWMLGLDALELNSDLLTRDDVGSEVDVSERSTTNLAANTVLVADAEILESRVSMFECKALKSGQIGHRYDILGRGQHIAPRQHFKEAASLLRVYTDTAQCFDVKSVGQLTVRKGSINQRVDFRFRSGLIHHSSHFELWTLRVLDP